MRTIANPKYVCGTNRSIRQTAGSRFYLLVAVLFLGIGLFASQGSAQNTINTVAGGGTINSSPLLADIPGPTAAVKDASGNLYVASPFSQYVFEMNASKVVSQFAGLGFIAYYDNPGVATAEPLWNPSGLAVDSSGNIYIADTDNNTIRKVDTSGNLSTVAGTSKPCFQGKCGDLGPATKAELNAPQGVAVDSLGNIYIADTGDNRVRVVKVATGQIIAFAGNYNVASCTVPTDPCGDGGGPKLAGLNAPMAVAVDSNNRVYIADTGDNRIRKVMNGVITTVAGTGVSGYAGDGGAATSAQLGGPRGVSIDKSFNIYIADTRNHRIRIVKTGTITTFAGNGTRGFSGDGASATSAELAGPNGVFVDSAKNVYISDTGNQRIREVSAGVINTILGGGNGGNAAALDAQLADPFAITVDSANNYYIADTSNNRVRYVSGGNITTVAGNGNAGYSGDGSAATSANLSSPEGVAVDGSNNLYIADTLNKVVREVSAGTITTFAGTGHPCSPSTALCGDGGPASSAWLTNPTTVAIDGSGNVFIADPGANRIREVVNGTISTVAGTGAAGDTGDGGLATAATLKNPVGVAIDAWGNIYIADSGNNVIRCVLGVIGGCGDTQHTYAVGDIMHYAFNGQINFQGDNGPALQASRWNPTAVSVDSNGNVFVGGGNNALVQRIDLTTGIVVTVAGKDSQYYYYGFKGDGGGATKAHIDNAGQVVDSNEDLLIADAGNNRIREVAHLVPVVTFGVKPLNFGSVTVGQNSQMVETFTNTGSDDMTTSTFGTSGDFSQTNNCPAFLAPSQSCNITVTFTPTKTGTRTGYLTVTDSAPGSPHTVKLEGTGM